MSPALIALAFAASTTPALLAWTPGGELIGASQLGIALTAWIALAGVPASRANTRAPWTAIAFALPPLALAAALDVRGGAMLAQTATSFAWGLLLVATMSSIAGRAQREGRAWSPYNAVWLALVVGTVCARFALVFGCGVDVAPHALGALARWSPLGWALELGSRGGAREWIPWGPLAIVALLFIARGRRAPEADA